MVALASFCLFGVFLSSWIVLNGNDHKVSHKQAWRISLSVWNYSTRAKPDSITSFKWLEDFMRVGVNAALMWSLWGSCSSSTEKCCTDNSLAQQWFWMELKAVTPLILCIIFAKQPNSQGLFGKCCVVCCLPAVHVHILTDTGCKMVSCRHSRRVERLPQKTDRHWWLAVTDIRCWPSSTRPCTQLLRSMLRENWSD